MAQETLPPIGAEMPAALQPSSVTDLPPIGAEMPAELHPDFTTANERDASGKPVVDPNTVGTFVRHLWTGINPLQLGQLLPWPKAAGGSGLDNPLLPGNLAKQMLAVKKEGDAAWEKGDKVTAAAKYIESVVPLFGPMMSHWGNEAQDHQWAALTGDAAAFATNLGLPAAAGAFKGRGPIAAAAPDGALTGQEAASNAFAGEHGVPLDTATATGSRAARAAQKVVANSYGGEGTASRLITDQQQALARTGGDLADQVAPASSPAQAGEGVRGTMTGLVRQLHGQADAEYAKLRAFEADPKYASVVEKTQSGAQKGAVLLEQQRSLGRVPSPAELQELRRIEQELDSYGYESHTIDHRGEWTPRGQGGTVSFTPGHGGAPVYDDIVGSMEGAPTRSALQGQIQTALETGNFRSEGAKNALEVAGRRLANDRSLSAPILPPDAGVERPLRETIGLAVDLKPVKTAMQPMYQALKREAELVPLMGDKAKALTALDRLVNGPDHAPLSVADAALGDLKSMARVDEPALRSVGQGQAAAAVRVLDRAVRARATAAGPEVLDALEFGRSATRGKWEVADLLDQVKEKPVAAFKQLTAPRDAEIGLLRKIQEMAPEQVATVGRAKLQEMLDLAGERGRFDHVDKLYADWQKLGTETKRILYGPDLTGELDKFFLLAKRIGENPNPSGTAHTLTALNFGSVPVTWAMSKLLYTPRGVRAATKLLEVESKIASGAAIKGAVRQAAWIDLASSAKAQGVPLVLSKAASGRGNE